MAARSWVLQHVAEAVAAAGEPGEGVQPARARDGADDRVVVSGEALKPAPAVLERHARLGQVREHTRLSARLLLAILEECDPDASNDRADYKRAVDPVLVPLRWRHALRLEARVWSAVGAELWEDRVVELVLQSTKGQQPKGTMWGGIALPAEKEGSGALAFTRQTSQGE